MYVCMYLCIYINIYIIYICIYVYIYIYISHLTEQSFPENRRNDRSLNETIWTRSLTNCMCLTCRENEKKKVFSLNIISACNNIL